MRLAWENLADAATLTAGSEIATLPATNVQQAHLSKKWHTLAGVKSSYLQLDMGSQVACSLFALLGTNLTSAATVRLRASKTDATATGSLELDTGKFPGRVKAGYAAIYNAFARGEYLSLSSDETPSLAFDFTAAHLADLIGRAAIAVTRAGATATRVNEQGLIETVAADTPRFDYDPVTLACKGLLIEEQRTNLHFQSGDPNAWGKANVTVVDGARVSPISGVNADDVSSTPGALSYITPTSDALALGTTYTRVLWAKPIAGTGLLAFEYSTGTTIDYAIFDLINGVVQRDPVEGAAVASIENWGDGWYRCRLTFTTAASGVPGCSATYIGAYGATTRRTTIALVGSDLQVGAFPTSHIPTTSASVTRNADVVGISSLGDWFNSGEGTVAAEFDTVDVVVGYKAVYSFNDATANNLMQSYVSPASVAAWEAVSGGVTQASLASAAVSASSVIRMAAAYKANDFAHSVNGVAPQTDAAGAVPAVTRLDLGAINTWTPGLNGHLRRFTYYPERLGNATLQAGSATTRATVEATNEILARYWRLDIEDTTLADNLQVGRLFLGPDWEPSINQLYDWSVTALDESQVGESYGGQSFPDERPQKRVLDFVLDFMNEAEMYGNAFALARSAGVVREVLAVPDIDGAYVSEQAVYGLVTASQPLVHRAARIYRQKFSIKERL